MNNPCGRCRLGRLLGRIGRHGGDVRVPARRLLQAKKQWSVLRALKTARRRLIMPSPHHLAFFSNELLVIGY